MRTENSGSQIANFSPAMNASLANVLGLIVATYLVCRHWHTVNIYALFFIFLPLGLQLFGQIQRARQIVHSLESVPVTSRPVILDLLFWAAITNLTLLIYIASLLRHIDGFI